MPEHTIDHHHFVHNSKRRIHKTVQSINYDIKIGHQWLLIKLQFPFCTWPRQKRKTEQNEKFKLQLIKKSAKSDRVLKIETDTRLLLTRLSNDDRPFELLSHRTDALDERHFSYSFVIAVAAMVMVFVSKHICMGGMSISNICTSFFYCHAQFHTVSKTII